MEVPITHEISLKIIENRKKQLKSFEIIRDVICKLSIQLSINYKCLKDDNEPFSIEFMKTIFRRKYKNNKFKNNKDHPMNETLLLKQIFRSNEENIINENNYLVSKHNIVEINKTRCFLPLEHREISLKTFLENDFLIQILSNESYVKKILSSELYCPSLFIEFMLRLFHSNDVKIKSYLVILKLFIMKIQDSEIHKLIIINEVNRSNLQELCKYLLDYDEIIITERSDDLSLYNCSIILNKLFTE